MIANYSRGSLVVYIYMIDFALSGQTWMHCHFLPPGGSIPISQHKRWQNHLFTKSEWRGQKGKQKLLTSMSRQADLSRVIWSAMVRLVKPGSRLANSTILMMHLVESSLNLSHSPRSSWTRWSELEFWTNKNTHSSACHTRGGVQPRLYQRQDSPSLTFTFYISQLWGKNSIYMLHQSFRGHTDGLMGNCIS